MQYLILLTFVLAPAYIFKLNILHLPTDVLMLWIFFLWLVFFVSLLAKKQLFEFFKSIKTLDKKVLIFTALFFLSGIVGLFAGGADRADLGQFVVLFLQPISLFFIARFVFRQNPKTKHLLLVTCYLLLALAGIYGALQYFTLIGLPQAWWGNSDEPKRALSFFIHPNFYALWCAPLLAFLIPDLGNRIKKLIVNRKLLIVNCCLILAWLLGGVGLLLSLSRAGWLGLAAALGIYLIVAADQKIRKIVFSGVIVIALVIVSVPNLRWRFLLPLYGEKSAVSRFSLWNTGLKAVKENPAFGIGLTGFGKNWRTLNTDPGLTDTHNFPHNIFLDFWVETGLLGLISFIGMAWIFIYNGIKNRRDIFKLGAALFLIAIIFQGLVDNPYFKNDLAMVFWIILSLSL